MYRGDLIIDSIAKELASSRVERDKALAEFTRITVIALLGIPSLCFKLGLAGALVSLVIASLWVWIGVSLRRSIEWERRLDVQLFDRDDPQAVGLLFESLPYGGR